MEEVSTIGLDIAKSVFHAHGVDASGAVIIRRRLKRGQVLPFFGRLEPSLIGIEACATAHHWARELRALGHDVRLMPAQYVKPYVKRNKNDAADAEAICEAVTRPNMRFVPIKTPEQQSVQALHRTRRMLVRHRVRLANTIRAHLAEFGVVASVGRNGLASLLRKVSEEPDDRIPPEVLGCLRAMAEQLDLTNRQIARADRRILVWHRSNALSQRLAAIPGVGPLTATALVAAVPDPGVFRSGRALSAWIGLTPRQNSTGGKARLGPISRAGDGYLRQLLVVGAMAMIKRVKIHGPGRHPWLASLLDRRTPKIAAVALANKTARIVWALMAHGEDYSAERPMAA